jgi:hypothetical protein
MNRRRLAILLLLCPAVPCTLAGQTPADLVQAMRARDQAVDKADVAAWERLTAPEFTNVTETGHLLTRAERVAELKNTKPATTPSICAQEQITMFARGSAATRRCLDGGVWWISVWAKSDSGWRVIAVQGTPAAK